MKTRKAAIVQGLGQAIELAALTILFVVYYKQRRMTTSWITLHLAVMLLLPTLRMLINPSLTRWAGSRCETIVHYIGAAMAVLALTALGYVVFLSLPADNLTTLLLFYLLAFATALQRSPGRTQDELRWEWTAPWISLLLVQGIAIMIVGNIQVLERNGFALSWSVAFYLTAVFAAIGTLLSIPIYPIPRHKENQPVTTHWGELPSLRQGGEMTMVLALLAAVPMLFLIDMPHNGGLGMAPQEFAFSMGGIGVAALALGFDLRKQLWKKLESPLMQTLPRLVAAVTTPAIFLLLSLELPRDLTVVSVLLFVSQLAMGFTIADMNQKCISVSPLISLAVLALSGFLQFNLGYRHYFALCIGCAVVIIAFCYAVSWLRTKRKQA